MGVAKIILSNRTKQKAEDLKKIYPNIEIVSWGDSVQSDIIINATSLGLKNHDDIKLNYETLGEFRSPLIKQRWGRIVVITFCVLLIIFAIISYLQNQH